MLEPSPETKRTQALLTNLVALTLVILALILLVAGYPLIAKQAPPTPTTETRLPLLTNTPTETASETPTPTISRTPRNTFTPTLTPTRTKISTPLPSLTPTGAPALPAVRPVAGKVYDLIEWTPAEADALIAYMNAYPNSLLAQAVKPDRSVYYKAFEYALLAHKEALLRFPEDERVERWRWGLAYNLAQTGAAGAAQAYADLVVQALNRGETDLPGLDSWFSQHEPRLRLSLIELEPTPGFLSSRLIQIQGAGSAFIWLLENTGAYQAQVLVNAFDFLNPGQMNTVIADLTADGAPEVAIFGYLPVNPSFAIMPPRVFSLAQSPATELYFSTPQSRLKVGVDFTNYWGISQKPGGQAALVFKSTVFPICPVTIQQVFTWNGQVFTGAVPSFEVEPLQSNLSYCDTIVKHAGLNWGADAAIQILEELAPSLATIEADTHPELLNQIKDEWRLRLALAYIVKGDVDQGRATLEELIAKPSAPGNEWLSAAQRILPTYRQPTDAYQACVQSAACNPSEALTFLINTHLRDAKQAPAVNEDALALLVRAGVQIRAAGYFDFDLDGQKDRWFTLRHRPFEKLELWLLVKSQPGEQAIRLGNVDVDKPTFTYQDEKIPAPIVFINAQTPFRLQHDPYTLEVYVEWVELPRLYPDKFKLALEPLQAALLSGADAKKTLQQLRDLEDYPGLLCKNNYTCDAYYYFLGLANELAGDERGAVEAYVTLWSNYIKSPYTTMARLKLVGGSAAIVTTPTATNTATPTAPTTPISLPTNTPAPISTSTPTPEDYPEPTEYSPYT